MKTRYKMRPLPKEKTLINIDTLLNMYSLIGLLFNMVIPLAMLLGILWLMITMCKRFVKSIIK